MVLSQRCGSRVDERMLFDIFCHFIGWMLEWMNLDYYGTGAHTDGMGVTMARWLYGFARVISR